MYTRVEIPCGKEADKEAIEEGHRTDDKGWSKARASREDGVYLRESREESKRCRDILGERLKSEGESRMKGGV